MMLGQAAEEQARMDVQPDLTRRTSVPSFAKRRMRVLYFRMWNSI